MAAVFFLCAICWGKQIEHKLNPPNRHCYLCEINVAKTFSSVFFCVLLDSSCSRKNSQTSFCRASIVFNWEINICNIPNISNIANNANNENTVREMYRIAEFH